VQDYKVGIIIGSGTGQEVADIFENTIYFLIENIGGPKVEIIRCPQVFHSYWSLKDNSVEEIRKIVKDEVRKLWEWIVSFYKRGGRVIFRTAINAETLYYLRKKGEALKVIPITLKDGRQILIIRDEMQGFYAINRYTVDQKQNRISLEEEFSYRSLEKILNFAICLANKRLRKEYLFWLMYKHHLFANILEKWFYSWCEKSSYFGNIFQPDTGLSHLFDYLTYPKLGKDLLLIVGNEIGDVIYELLMFYLKIGSKNTLYTENIYLHPEIKELHIFQTVHGSADDIVGTGKLNPIASIRVAAAVLSFITKNEVYLQKVENATKEVIGKGIVSENLQNNIYTQEVLNCIYKEIKKLGENLHGRY